MVGWRHRGAKRPSLMEAGLWAPSSEELDPATSLLCHAMPSGCPRLEGPLRYRTSTPAYLESNSPAGQDQQTNWISPTALCFSDLLECEQALDDPAPRGGSLDLGNGLAEV